MMKNNPFYLQDILSADQFSLEEVKLLIKIANEMKIHVNEKGHIDLLRGKVMCALFYEPSSRTFSSFITSIHRLGGGYIPIHGVASSSVAKGETLEDTIRTFEKYADIIVLRHPEIGAAKLAADYCTKPIINAGDGNGEHPTQALLDVFTISSHFKEISGLTVTMVGDMKNGRTVHSLLKLLSLYQNMKMNFIAPKELQIQPELCELLKKRGIKITLGDDIKTVLPVTDVLYVTRVQKERFTDLELYEKLKHRFIITHELIQTMKDDAIIMHPLPRVGEIDPRVDEDKRALYIKDQMRNGMFMRMAILASILRPENLLSYVKNSLFSSIATSDSSIDAFTSFQIYQKELTKKNNYYVAKSLGPEMINMVTKSMDLANLKKMYMDMIYPVMLPESKSTLLVRDIPFELKHGESGRTSSSIYLNHRVPLYNDLWDKRLLIRLLETVLYDHILEQGQSYGVITIPTSSSPEFTSSLLDNSPFTTSRIVAMGDTILTQEKGAHTPVYGSMNSDKPWIMVDDVFTSGNTMRGVLNTLRLDSKKTAESNRYYGIVLTDRNPEVSKTFSVKEKCPIYSLVTLDDVLRYHWKDFSTLQKKIIQRERPI